MRIVGIGDNVVDRYLAMGQMFPGGNALNVAVFARRAGADAAYIGALGTDRAGRQVLRALQDEGVDVSRVRTVTGSNAYADVDLVDGDRKFVGSSLGVSMFTPDDGDVAMARAADLVHSSTYSGLDTWVQAQRGDLAISFDFSDRTERSYVEVMAPGLASAQFSGSAFSDQEAEDLARWVASIGTRLVLVTRGARSAIACMGDRCWSQQPRPIVPVDTLGAGDAFIGALLVAHLNGAEVPEAMARAADAAAVTCGYFGGFGHGGPIEERTETAQAAV